MELKAIQLTKQYGSKTAVNHLNLSLSNGVYGLLGANGAGKTTLMRLLCDIQTPTSGKITLDGKNISVLGEKYRNLLGYLPQQFGYYPDFTAWDFLMYVAALKGLSEKQAHKKATELLEAVDLAEKRNLKIKTFSGGMKQRLGIAQAMLNNPRILILDEPTAGLDPKERVRFRNLISAFSKDRIVMYCSGEVDCICMECVANGKAAEKYDGEFIQYAEEISDEEKRTELFRRTPGYCSWQGEYWLACCDDYCEYLGDVGYAELKEMNLVSIIEEYKKVEGMDFDNEMLEKGGSLAGYLFRCIHCGKFRLNVDCD